MLEHLDRAGVAAETLGDDVRRARVAGHRAHTLWFTGRPRQALNLAETQLALAHQAADLEEESFATFNMGEAQYSLGEFEQAAELLGRALGFSVQPQGQAAPQEVTARRWRAQALAEMGRFEEAAGLARDAIGIARARNHPYALANGITGWGIVCARHGTFQDAIPLLEEGLQFSRTLGFRSFVPTIGNLLAEALAQTGRSAEAQAILEEVPGSWAGTISRALALLLLGRPADVSALSVGALSDTRERGERGVEAWLVWLLGEIDARESPSKADAAAVRFREALALAEPRGMRPLAAHCHLGLGKLYRRSGQREQAQEHLTTATTMYREMGMTYWLEKAEAERKD
jgi:tetratricopeptide (TPR) repeat protein